MKTTIFCMLLITACATRSAPQRHADGPRSPLHVAIVETNRSEGRAELAVTIRRLGTTAPIQLQWDAPPGVQVVGLPAWISSTDARIVTYPATVTWSGQPEPLWLRAAIKTPTLRVAARVAYRFGAPEPTVAMSGSEPIAFEVGALKLTATVAATLEPTAQPMSQVPGRVVQ
jgi:hypothetical protein